MKDMEDAPQGPPCAICGKPQSRQYRPFCSRRCADVDLGRWMTGAYRAPAAEEDADEDDIARHRGDAASED